MDIQKILQALNENFDNTAADSNLTEAEKLAKENVREILIGYQNGTTVTETELIQGILF